MSRGLVLGFGAASYGVFFATFLYLIGFLAGFGVPKSIDSGTPGALGPALLVDTALLLLFGIQHSVMARPGFKAWWTRFVPRPIERSVYVLASSLALIALYAAWQPIPAPVWELTSPVARGVATALYFAGFGLVLFSTFLIDHFDLFGLRQVVLHFRERAYSEKRFVMPLLYRVVRHPLYVGWITVFWAAPTMSAGRFLFALVMTAYIWIAIPLEERDLAAHHGEPYRRWRDATPAFLPRLRRKRSDSAPSGAAEPA
jgi:protein-S-isoprenylcysteine O-methyltransferase Ste14